MFYPLKMQKPGLPTPSQASACNPSLALKVMLDLHSSAFPDNIPCCVAPLASLWGVEDWENCVPALNTVLNPLCWATLWNDREGQSEWRQTQQLQNPKCYKHDVRAKSRNQHLGGLFCIQLSCFILRWTLAWLTLKLIRDFSAHLGT